MVSTYTSLSPKKGESKEGGEGKEVDGMEEGGYNRDGVNAFLNVHKTCPQGNCKPSKIQRLPAS